MTKKDIEHHYDARHQFVPISLEDRYQSFLKTAASDPMYTPGYTERAASTKKYMEMLENETEFPYWIAYEDDYYYFDILEDVLWKTLGPSHGHCGKEYDYANGRHGEHFYCRHVEVDEDYYKRMWETDQNDFWGKHYKTYENFIDKIDEGPVNHDHSHIGEWKIKWLVKTGYDAGIQLFMFKKKEDLDDFITKSTLGPQYETIGDSNDSH